MNKTPIDWVRNPDGTQGYTWNPITGCLNGCEYCYARKLANGRLRNIYLSNIMGTLHLPSNNSMVLREMIKPLNDPFYPRFWPERLKELDPIWKRKHFGVGGGSKVQAKGIFVCDMSDLFGIGIPGGWTRQVLDVIKANHGHRFYLLTKQPQNLIKFSPFPDNCWVGVTATDGNMAFQALIYLDRIQAGVRYLSFEPLLGRVMGDNKRFGNPEGLNEVIDWLIIGSLTLTLEDYNNSNYALRRGLKLKQWGKKWTVQPDIEWVEEIVNAADKVGIPVFLKDNLKPLIDKHCPDESPIQPNHDSLLRMKHPFICKDCDETGCHRCGVIWGLRQEMPR